MVCSLLGLSDGLLVCISVLCHGDLKDNRRLRNERRRNEREKAHRLSKEGVRLRAGCEVGGLIHTAWCFYPLLSWSVDNQLWPAVLPLMFFSNPFGICAICHRSDKRCFLTNSPSDSLEAPLAFLLKFLCSVLLCNAGVLKKVLFGPLSLLLQAPLSEIQSKLNHNKAPEPHEILMLVSEFRCGDFAKHVCSRTCSSDDQKKSKIEHCKMNQCDVTAEHCLAPVLIQSLKFHETYVPNCNSLSRTWVLGLHSSVAIAPSDCIILHHVEHCSKHNNHGCFQTNSVHGRCHAKHVIPPSRLVGVLHLNESQFIGK